jgi:hypothetical protein
MRRHQKVLSQAKRAIRDRKMDSLAMVHDGFLENSCRSFQIDVDRWGGCP